MRKYTILADARALGKRPSGIGIYFYNLTKELRRDGEFVLLLITDVCESDEMKALRDAGVKVFCYGKPIEKSISLVSYYRFVQKCIDRVRPDIFWEINILVPLPVRNPGGLMMSTIHDMFPVQYPEHFDRGYRQYFTFGLKMTIRCFDTFIYNSAETRTLSERYFPGLKKKDAFVGFISVPRLPALPVTDNGCFLYVGNLETRKGTDILIKAFRRYRDGGGTCGLRLAGKVRDEEIRVLLSEEALNEGIEYLGYISEEQKAQEYASCRAFVFPSRAEGFGIPVVEAMNYYKPVLVLDLPIYHEIVGECIGYVTAPAGQEAEEFGCAMARLEEASVDRAAYEAVLRRYDPEVIGELFRKEFRKRLMERGDRGNLKNRARQLAKSVLPVNTIRKVRAGQDRKLIREMAAHRRVPFDRNAFPEGVNLIGCIRLKTGLGQGCRLTAKVLKDSGIPLALKDFALSEEYSGPTEYDSLIGEEAPYGINLFFINMHEFARAFFRTGSARWDRHYNIAYWSWEAERFPEEWAPLLTQVDEVWTPSEYTAEAVRTVTSKPVVPIGYAVPEPVCSGADRSFFGLPENVFLYLVLFDNNSMSERKNPQAAVEAFKKAFPPGTEDAGLVLKITAPDRKLLRELQESLKGYRVWFLDTLYDKEDLNALIRCCDVYVSLHRAEGFGMVLAEAMLLGVPTVATAYSSNPEFQDEESACLVKYEKVPVGRDLWPFRSDYRWAEADADDAAGYLRKLKEDEAFRKRISENGKKKAEECFAAETIREKMLERYRHILGRDKA